MPSTLIEEPKYSAVGSASELDNNGSKVVSGVARRLRHTEASKNGQIHRKSLINLEDVVSSTRQSDDEWDAILGELSVLESQFDSELYNNLCLLYTSDAADE